MCVGCNNQLNQQQVQKGCKSLSAKACPVVDTAQPQSLTEQVHPGVDRFCTQDSVEERFKERKAAAEEHIEPEVDEQGKPLNKKQRLQAKRAAEKERARQRQAAQGLMPSAVCLFACCRPPSLLIAELLCIAALNQTSTQTCVRPDTFSQKVRQPILVFLMLAIS